MIISKNFFIFIGVGAVTALIDIGMMQLLIYIGIHYIAATTLGFFVGLIANFLLHTYVTFGSKFTIKVLLRFTTVVLINYLATLFIVYSFQILINQPLMGKFISLPLVAINGFFLSKYWIYK